MYNSASLLLVNILSIKAHSNNPDSSGFNFLNDSLQGNCPRRTENGNKQCLFTCQVCWIHVGRRVDKSRDKDE